LCCPQYHEPVLYEGAVRCSYSEISIKSLEEYKNTPGAILVDVRESDEFASGHIPGAVNEPLSIINQTTLSKDAPLFLYCLRGTRSKRAAGILRSMGYKTVKSIGGISAYKGTIEHEDKTQAR